ncbi:T9SS type A sorting domain-containing protein [Pontibacter indicus]|uniref:Por secretion system C-terminal sorting domain-containing protein n=1 Tax=Pontibacter indicus TaxID=1317125 RepID=A0A1R3XCW6_9BACT|nr:T9SS type A sorting domain-containing protein [Pontibacter indicus]SIT88751.1 Por secretion system C-terminal sorting domain-containing protein [Pontibacter indicus]
MKYVYTLVIVLILFIASAQLAAAQGQTTIDIQPKCTLANQNFELTIYRLTGNDFNGSTTITINGQVFSVFVERTKAQIKIAVPANLISTAGNVQVVANTASGVSQGSVLSVVGPLSVTSTSFCGRTTLTAQGAPANGSYRWYNAAGQYINGATSASLSVTQAGQYAVSIVTATGCETARVPVNATVKPQLSANTEFARQDVTVGKPAVLQLNSEVFDRSHGASIRWEAYNFVTGARNVLGLTEAPKGGSASFQVPNVEANTYYEAFITAIDGMCYEEYMLYATTQGIVSLPVELVSFKAQSTKEGVQLSWKTASELDNRGFEVEASADGKNFRKVAFVESKVGTTSLTQHYSFLDTRAVAGANYYRLKQIDFDGAFEYSKTVAINITLASAATVYPTLATTDITVRLASTDDQVTIAVADMAGKQLLAVQNPADRQVVLPVQQLQQGVYFVTVTSGTQKEVIRFVKR